MDLSLANWQAIFCFSDSPPLMVSESLMERSSEYSSITDVKGCVALYVQVVIENTELDFLSDTAMDKDKR